MTTAHSLANRHIILAVSAGIAAYKAPMLVRALTAKGAEEEWGVERKERREKVGVIFYHGEAQRKVGGGVTEGT